MVSLRRLTLGNFTHVRVCDPCLCPIHITSSAGCNSPLTTFNGLQYPLVPHQFPPLFKSQCLLIPSPKAFKRECDDWETSHRSLTGLQLWALHPDWKVEVQAGILSFSSWSHRKERRGRAQQEKRERKKDRFFLAGLFVSGFLTAFFYAYQMTGRLYPLYIFAYERGAFEFQFN